jgi:hypothetical protein
MQEVDEFRPGNLMRSLRGARVIVGTRKRTHRGSDMTHIQLPGSTQGDEALAMELSEAQIEALRLRNDALEAPVDDHSNTGHHHHHHSGKLSG